MTDSIEIMQLRSDLSMLRERVAILESRSFPQPQSMYFIPIQRWYVGTPQQGNYGIDRATIEGSYGASRVAPHAAAPAVANESWIVKMKG